MVHHRAVSFTCTSIGCNAMQCNRNKCIKDACVEESQSVWGVRAEDDHSMKQYANASHALEHAVAAVQ